MENMALVDATESISRIMYDGFCMGKKDYRLSAEQCTVLFIHLDCFDVSGQGWEGYFTKYISIQLLITCSKMQSVTQIQVSQY